MIPGLLSAGSITHEVVLRPTSLRSIELIKGCSECCRDEIGMKRNQS